MCRGEGISCNIWVHQGYRSASGNYLSDLSDPLPSPQLAHANRLLLEYTDTSYTEKRYIFGGWQCSCLLLISKSSKIKSYNLRIQSYFSCGDLIPKYELCFPKVKILYLTYNTMVVFNCYSYDVPEPG